MIGQQLLKITGVVRSNEQVLQQFCKDIDYLLQFVNNGLERGPLG